MKIFVVSALMLVVGFVAGVGTSAFAFRDVLSGVAISIESKVAESERIRAARDRCHERYAAAAAHARNVVYLYDERSRPDFDVKLVSVSDVLRLYLVGVRGLDPALARAMPILTAQQRAVLALTLERSGEEGLARREWAEAQQVYTQKGQSLTRENVVVRMNRDCAQRPWDARPDLF